jgi:hypothetical protein
MRYIVSSVPERRHWLDVIREQVPQLEVAEDYSRNAVDTFLLAMLMIGEDAAVHFEDDAELTSDFRAKAEAVIARRPTMLVNFFSRLGEDVSKGSRAQPGSAFMYNIGFYLPPGCAVAISAYYPKWRPRNSRSTMDGPDTLIRDFLVSRRQRYWQQVPSLVQHRGLRSLLGHPGKRQSATFVP